jgi:chromate reductase
MTRPVVLAVSGSLRAESSNTGLIRVLERLVGDDFEVRTDAAIGSLPFYNADLDIDETLPSAVRGWRDAVASCDVLWIAAPEYNFGPTAVLKNAIDWATRPLGQHALRGKIVSIVSSAGSTGGRHMTEQISGILGLLGNTVVSEPAVHIEKGAERISVDGTVTDPTIDEAMIARIAAVRAAILARG